MMASIGHVIVGLVAARALRRTGGERPAPASLVASLTLAGLALAPDLDVVGFALGVPYASEFGHRGASHALLTALVLGVFAGVVLAAVTGWQMRWTALACVGAIASHGLLDTLTTGGEGVAVFWPFSNARLFAPVALIPVAPIGPAFLSARGLAVCAAELLLFAPLWWLAFRPRRKPAAFV